MLREKSIKKDGKVTVTLSLDHSASGSAAMVSTYGPAGGHATSKSVVVAPAGSAPTTTDVKGKGLFRIVVDMKSNADKGHLAVSVNGVKLDEEEIKGDTRWVCTVE